jgi:hypothetical protein
MERYITLTTLTENQVGLILALLEKEIAAAAPYVAALPREQYNTLVHLAVARSKVEHAMREAGA